MKLAKLSLAAVVAVTAMTTFASAASLEEAIKGVDLTGFMRYRFYSEDGFRDSTDSANNLGDRHRFSAPFIFTMPVADGFKAGMTVRYEGSEYAADAAESASTDFSVTKAWFKYSNKVFDITAGKIEVTSPWTDPTYGGDRGNGAIAFYKGVPGWTFAAAGFVNTNIAAPFGANAVDAMEINDLGGVNITTAAKTTAKSLNSLALGQENLYAAAALGAIGPVNVQFWLANMTNVFDYSAFMQVDMKMAGFDGKIQANQLQLSEVDVGEEDTGLFWAAEAGYTIAGFRAGLGYIQNDDKQSIHTLSADDMGMIKAGKQLYYETTNMPDAETVFGKVSYTMGAYSVGAGYAEADVGDGDGGPQMNLGKEWYVEAGYQYSKNLGFGVYYSDLNIDERTTDSDVVGRRNVSADNKQLRFEAKYSF